jgi:hypothetical protein
MSTKIYKFCSLNEFSRDIIITGKFFFSDWEKMNDPMEGYFQYYTHEHTQQEIEAIYTEKNKYGISCFSKEYTEILMWSHYADNHRGICIEVEIDNKLCKKENIKKQNIKYLETIQMLIKDDGTSPDTIELLGKKINKWKYEKEVRMFCSGKNQTKEIGTITKIILGVRCKDNDLIQTYIDNKNIQIVETNINFDTNKIQLNA